jgi:hypothetical protein
MAQDEGIRESLSGDQRVADLRLTIDPGFVNYRRIEARLGDAGMRYVDAAIAALPPMPEGLQRGRIDHVYARYLLAFCNAVGIETLGEVLGSGRGTLFCSTLEVAPCEAVYSEERVRTNVVLAGDFDLTVSLEYSTKHIHADTTRLELFQGGPMAVVAEFWRKEGDCLVFHPLLMGGPWLEEAENEAAPFAGLEWYSYEYFEVFVEDVDEFGAVRDMAAPENWSQMADISEAAVKRCLGEILADATRPDWGGEQSDHFSAHIHLRGRPATAAFLLKGPARFEPMRLDNLGKRNDQIVRLAKEPAQLLVVQHCHDVTPPVRDTLRAFAVQPGRPRRYLLMDGRDTFRLLTAYDKVERALELTAELKEQRDRRPRPGAPRKSGDAPKKRTS